MFEKRVSRVPELNGVWRERELMLGCIEPFYLTFALVLFPVLSAFQSN